MAPINAAKTKPKRQEMEISIPTGKYNELGNYVDDSDWQNDWPPASYDDVRHSATSVQKLKLELEVHGMKVHSLQIPFQNISIQPMANTILLIMTMILITMENAGLISTVGNKSI